MNAVLILMLALLMAGCGGLDSVNVNPGPPVVTLPGDAYDLLDGALREHVAEGHVDYPALCRDDRLDEFLTWVADTDPETFEVKQDRLAFWINVYNSYTLKAICARYPVGSINDLHFGGLVIGTVLKKTIWDRKLAIVGGKQLSLNQIEHSIIRPEFRDARAHFALVCAAKSCPPLRSEAYRGARLDDQLDAQGRRFLTDESKNRFDMATKTADFSKILDWYAGDFGNSDLDILLFATRFLPDDLALAVRADPEGWKTGHTKYDWSLNE